MHGIHSLDIEFEQGGQLQVITPAILQDEQDTILIDCGYANFEAYLEAAANRVDLTLASLTKIIITHHDIDHMGSLAGLKRMYPGAEIIAHELEKPYIEGTAKSLRLEQAESGLASMPEDAKPFAEQFISFLLTMEPAAVDRTVYSGEMLPWCGGIEIVHTPGHMPGHISLYLPSSKTLIAADAVVLEQGKLNIANPQYTLDMEATLSSVRRLLEFDIDRLICYHGGVLEGDVRDALKKLLEEYGKWNEIIPFNEKYYDELVDIWHRAVVRTHTFLTEADMRFYHEIVRDGALRALEIWISVNEDRVPTGFIGLDGSKIEALFVDPDHHGKGIGRRLIQHAESLKGDNLQVDVNEQNEGACAFYQRLGFIQIGRSELDPTGKPFPILHLGR